MTAVLDGVPRLTRHPSVRQTHPPLTRSQYVRLWLWRRLNDAGRRLFVADIPPFPCECDGQHPHADWPR